MTLLAGGSLDPEGPVARSMADLWWLLLVLGAVPFLVVMVLLLGGLFRRRPPEEPLGEPRAGAGPGAGAVVGQGAPSSAQTAPQASRHFNRWLIGGGVVMPVVLVVVVLVATVEAMRDVPSGVPEGALVVEIVGHQWWWEVRYPEAGVTTANELHLPVGRPVALQLASADVIHSFWVPQLAGKLDLLPDGTNTLVLEADEAGEYRGDCAEFCGLQHTKMQLGVVAEPAEAFAAWLAAQRQPAVEPASSEAARGRRLFLEGGCGTCHTIRGTTARGERGPDLTHVASRPALGAGTLPNTRGDLARWVDDPHTVKEGVAMPGTELAEDELGAVVAYLESLR